MVEGTVLEGWVRLVSRKPTSYNNKSAASAHFVRSREHGSRCEPRRHSLNVTRQSITG